MTKLAFKQQLSIKGMLKVVRSYFDQIKKPVANHKNCKIKLSDCLMSGLAIFEMKYPSLLQFDQHRSDGIVS